MADDTALFLRDKQQIEHAISLVDLFSAAPGLKLNKSKCEILCLFQTEDKSLHNIPVKNCVKYLGIHICNDPMERQLLSFSTKLHKTKSILNMWLQRDLSIIVRILLTKAEGVSRFVYPALSLTVLYSTCKDINNIFINFVWKNKHHYLRKEIMSGFWEEGGFELLDFKDLNYTFKLKWVKECLRAPDSIWYFIPHNIFKEVGGLHFLLRCNYNVSKLPLRLSKFSQQVLLAWKLCYSHNFSPHKTIIWNNDYITKGNKSLYCQNWVEKNVILLKDLFNNEGHMMSYEMFLQTKGFPIKPKEYRFIVSSIPNGLKELMKGCSNLHKVINPQQTLYSDGIQFISYKCTYKHIRRCFYSKRKIIPHGKTHWNSLFNDINWSRTWLVPFKCLISISLMRKILFLPPSLTIINLT